MHIRICSLGRFLEYVERRPLRCAATYTQEATSNVESVAGWCHVERRAGDVLGNGSNYISIKCSQKRYEKLCRANQCTSTLALGYPIQLRFRHVFKDILLYCAVLHVVVAALALSVVIYFAAKHPSLISPFSSCKVNAWLIAGSYAM